MKNLEKTAGGTKDVLAFLLRQAGNSLQHTNRALRPGSTLLNAALYQSVPEIINATARGGEVSTAERTKQLLASLAAGRLTASPRARQAAMNYMTGLKAVGPDKTKEVLRFGRAAGLLGLPLTFNTALPFFADTSGPFYNNVQKSMKTFEELTDAVAAKAQSNGRTMGEELFERHGDNLKRWLEPSTWLDQAQPRGQEMLAQAGTDLVNSGAPEYFMKNVGLNLAFALPGTIAGLTFGNALYPENKRLPAAKQIENYRKRMIAQTVGATALGFGGAALANHLMKDYNFSPKSAPAQG